MKQSRSTSLLKSVISTAVGFSLSLFLQWLILPLLLGVPMPLHANLTFAAIMTVVSIGRGYLLERFFEMMGWRVRMSPFAMAVLAERQRQQDVEGWDDAHDDREHGEGDLAMAGAFYARYAGSPPQSEPPSGWDWGDRWWKPAGFRRDLVKACALIIAEGEKFDRNRKRRAAIPIIRTASTGTPGSSGTTL